MILLSMPSNPREPDNSIACEHAMGSPYLSHAQPSRHKRPKLSLQTQVPSSFLSQKSTASRFLRPETDSPTTHNTYVNTYELPPPTPSTATHSPAEFPASGDALTRRCIDRDRVSPFGQDLPYHVQVGMHTILKNSPLPRCPPCTISTMPKQRRLFPSPKQVSFREGPEEIIPGIPAWVVENAEDEISNPTAAQEAVDDRRARIQAEDGHAIPAASKCKRQQDWIWRPLPADVLGSQADEIRDKEADGRFDSVNSWL